MIETDTSNVVMSAEIVPLFAQVTTTDKESVAEKLVRFEADATALATELEGLQVKDQESYDRCAEKVLDAKAFVKDKTEWFEPIRLLTFGLYQKVLDRRGGIIDRVRVGAATRDADLKKFERDQEEARQRLQREAEEKQRREEQERKLEAATAAEAVGLSEQAVETILTAPSVAPAPIAAPTLQRVKGLGHRENWCAEITDLHALVKAVAKDKKLLPLLEANMPALNAQARSLKTAMQIPGVKAVNKGV
jgi:hypothetical protein